MIKKLIPLFAIILLMVLVSADTFKQNEPLDLKHPVRLDNFPNTNIACNISVFDPFNIELVNYQPMTNDYEYHNYTLPGSNTSELGTYLYDITCSTGTSNQTSSFNFDITPSGKVSSISNSVVLILILVFSFIIFCLFMWGAIIFPFKNKRNEEGKVISVNDLKFLKVGLMALSYLTLMWIFFMLMETSRNFLTLDTASRVFSFFFNFMLYALFPTFLGFVIISIMLKFQDLKYKELIDRGVLPG